MDPAYDASYREFDTALARRLRREAYDEDVGQHSWATAEELRSDAGRLRLSPTRRLLDLGCGAAGPLTYLAALTGCTGTGLDVSAAAVAAGRARASSLGLGAAVTVAQADLDRPLPLPAASFDAVMAIDVVLHLRDRAALFREVARVLVPGGRFLVTDAGVLAGAVTAEERAARGARGPTALVAPGVNERALAEASLRLLETEDRTASVVANAGGRLAARAAHRGELERMETAPGFAREQRYLETVVALARRCALLRILYLCEATHG